MLPEVVAAADVPVREERLSGPGRAQDEGIVVLYVFGVIGPLLCVHDDGRMAVTVADAQVPPSGEVPHEGLPDAKAHGLLQLGDEEVVLTDLHLGAGHAGNP